MKKLLIAGLMAALLAGCGKQGIELVTIEGDEVITVDDYNHARDILLDQLRQAWPEEKVKEFEKLSRAEVELLPPQQQQMWFQLQPRNAFEGLKDMKIVYRKAKEEGFADRDDIKAKVQFLTEQFIATSYMNDGAKGKKFSEDEVLAECDRLRELGGDNPQIAGMTASQCLDMARMRLSVRHQQTFIADKAKAIREGYRVVENKDNIQKYILDGNSPKQKKKKKKKKKKKGNLEGIDLSGKGSE